MTSGSSGVYDNEFVINGTARNEMIDYFCPFCNEKLFRGKIDKINMPCPHCCRYVRDADYRAASRTDDFSLSGPSVEE